MLCLSQIASSIAFLVVTACLAPAATPARLSEVTGVDQAAFSADGAQVIVGTKDDTISLWNAANGTPITGEINGPGQAFVMSADAHHVLVSRPEGGARVFDPKTGAARSPVLEVHLRIAAHPEAVFTPNGQHVLIFEPGSAAIFAVATGQRVATLSLRTVAKLKPGSSAAQSLPSSEEEEEDLDLSPSAHFTRDGTRCFILTAQGVVTAYDITTWKPLAAPMRHPAAPSAYKFGMALSDDARWMATFDDPGENGPKGHLQVWDTIKGALVGKPAIAVNGLAGEFVAGSSSRLLVTPGRGEASVRELPSYKKIAAIPAHDDVDGPAVALSPDGQWALSWGSDRIVRIQSTTDGAVKESQVFQARITQVLMLPDSNGCLLVFDNSTFLIQEYYDYYVMKISFPDLRIEKSLRTTEDLRHVALSPSGNRFLLQSNSTDKERISVYDVADFKKLAD